MKHVQRVLGVTIAVLILQSAGIVFGDEGHKTKEPRLTEKGLPPAVVTAFAKSYPRATIKKVEKETKDSVLYYEIESMDGKTSRNLLYLADGKVSEIEEQIDASTLPQAIKDKIKADHPKAKIVTAEHIIRGDTTQYEVLVEEKETKTEILFDASGKVLSSAIENEDDDDDEEADD